MAIVVHVTNVAHGCFTLNIYNLHLCKPNKKTLICKTCQLFVGKWFGSYLIRFYIFQISLMINMPETIPRKVRFILYISSQSYFIP